MPSSLLEFLYMPFDLSSTAQTFQPSLAWLTFLLYDSVPIASADTEEHKQHLQLVLNHFQKYGVIINPSKCQFGAT